MMQLLAGLPTDALRLFLWLVILAAIFVPLERLFALHAQKILRRGFLTDIGLYFLNNLLPTIILSVPLALLASASFALLPKFWLSFVAALPLPVRLFCALLIVEIGAYWGHRWSHEIPFLWYFHKVHHAASQIDWLVNTHAHPLDMAFVRLCGLTLVFATGFAQSTAGAPNAIPVVVSIIGMFWSFFVHANVRWRFGPLEQVLANPAFHHWHHTKYDHIDHNYAAMFPWVDRMFGTLHLPPNWPAEYGVGTEQERTARLVRYREDQERQVKI